MTREDKIKKRQERSFRRKKKRIDKDRSYIDTAYSHDRRSISFGRKYQHGSIFICCMGYGSCEDRGYCNGDC